LNYNKHSQKGVGKMIKKPKIHELIFERPKWCWEIYISNHTPLKQNQKKKKLDGKNIFHLQFSHQRTHRKSSKKKRIKKGFSLYEKLRHILFNIIRLSFSFFLL